MVASANETVKALPGEVDECHRLIRELLSLLENKNADISRLKVQLQNLLRGRYGRSTEKLSPGQLMLFRQQLEELLQQSKTEETEVAAAAVSTDLLTKNGKHGGGGRKPINPSLKRERRDYFPTAEEMVCQCGADKKEIGIEKLEQLDYVPASLKVIEHVTHKFACKTCEENIVQGQRPSQIHNGGKAAEGLIAQISVAKHADHMPLHRQQEIFARDGVEVSRSSMGRWLDFSAQALKPLFERMHQLVLQSRVVQADESPVLFIDKNRPAKKIKTGYVWVLYGDTEHPYTIYDFQPDRSAERARKLLTGFCNLLLTDGYGGYEWYPSELSANCNVHARRYFEKASKYDKEKAGLILGLYSELYVIESKIKDLPESDKVNARELQSAPLLNQIKILLQQWQLSTPPKTALGIAINYSLTRWQKLCRFVEHGVLRPDTNLVENAIRPIAVGRKNWLHIGSEEALETASIHASLVNSCKRLSVNPYLYLRDVLIRIGGGQNCLIDDLLPDKWHNQNPLS